MKVLLFHPVRLPALHYGGVERVVIWLAKGLLERGHDVSVAALAGSRVPAGVKLLPREPTQLSALDLLPEVCGKFDVIHCMAPPEQGFEEKVGIPTLLTVHGNGQPGEKFSRNAVFLSRDHAKRHQAEGFIYNGIDPEECLFEPTKKQDHFLFLSKTSWKVKNLRGAMRICKKASVRLRICGGSRPYSLRLKAWFTRGQKWVGSVGGREKAKELAHAQALLFPVIWAEPFGLVVVEALMSGTPVIASRLGSLPELIPDSVGALIDPESDQPWIDRVLTARHAWEPEACRQWALQNFHYAKMAEEYEKAYKKIGGGEFIQQAHPMRTPNG